VFWAFFHQHLYQPEERYILEQMRADRDEEYNEFCERCDALIGELERETGHEKFTFAELEETEEDLQKLENWWGKINTRDFIGGNRRQEALDKLEFCQTAYRNFASEVYARKGSTHPVTRIYEMSDDTMSAIDKWKQGVKKLKTETFALYLAYKDPRTPWFVKSICRVGGCLCVQPSRSGSGFRPSTRLSR
jgi:hypothetical protein